MSWRKTAGLAVAQFDLKRGLRDSEIVVQLVLESDAPQFHEPVG